MCIRQDAWRVYNARDLVCSVPRMMGFAHVGTPVELRADGSYAVQGELTSCRTTRNARRGRTVVWLLSRAGVDCMAARPRTQASRHLVTASSGCKQPHHFAMV